MPDFPGLTFSPTADQTNNPNNGNGGGPIGSATPIQDAIQTLRFNVPRFGGAHPPVDPSLLFGASTMPNAMDFLRRIFGQIPQGGFSVPSRPFQPGSAMGPAGPPPPNIDLANAPGSGGSPSPSAAPPTTSIPPPAAPPPGVFRDWIPSGGPGGGRNQN